MDLKGDTNADLRVLYIEHNQTLLCQRVFKLLSPTHLPPQHRSTHSPTYCLSPTLSAHTILPTIRMSVYVLAMGVCVLE